MEGRSEGKRLGIRHPKRGGQRESNVEEQSLCERGGGRRRQAERQKEKQRPRGIQRPSPLTPTLTDEGETDPQTHPLSERGAEGVAWAWQLLSALTVSLCPRRSLSTNPDVVSGSSAKHLPDQSRREQQSRGRRDLCQPSAPICPGPGNNFRSSSLAQLPGGRVPGWQGREGARAWRSGRSVAQCAPSGSGLGGRSFPEGCDPTGFCVPEARTQGPVVASLPGPLRPGYLESWSSLAFCRIWQTSVMG